MSFRGVAIFLLLATGSSAVGQEIQVEVGRRVIRSFDPRHALGAGLDGYHEGDTTEMLSPPSVREMLGAGLGPVSLRLRTELAVDAWHWNPKGRWSDPAHAQGYWTSDARPDPKAPIVVSYGYKLPRRGDTLDEANDDGYSRLVDGDTNSFWKSNPYLTSAYTGEPDKSHPQWVVLDFGKQVPINAVNILWGEPYATRFRVEYANSGRVYFGGHPWNVWHRFPKGDVTGGRGGEQFLNFGKTVRARFLRIWMTEGSGTAPAGSGDPRDTMGYAIREIRAGEAGHFDFDDHVVHRPHKAQTLCYASSTDPWHRACDRDPKVEQPGIDRVMRCGITRGLPVMLPVPVLYDTPENAVALAEYVRAAGYRVGRHELGEEPDGQRVDPRDFGALYAQVARGIRRVAPDAAPGGPSFVTVDVARGDDQTYRFDKRWWIRSFRKELQRRGQSGDLRFLSFEWYPFDDVLESEENQLPRASGMLERAMARFRSLGLPLVIGEFNYSVFPCRQEVDLSGALLNAETAAQFLCAGGDVAYYYGYEPNRLEQTCGSWGNHLMLLNSKGGTVPVASYHALRLVTGAWLDPAGGPHRVLPVTIKGLKEGEKSRVSLFAVGRPDGGLSLLVVNKHRNKPLRLSLGSLAKEGKGSLTVTTYSATEYEWRAKGEEGHPSRNLPPVSHRVPATQPVAIPAWSLAVLCAP